MKLSALGHACFMLETDDHSIIFDPWLAGNPEAAISPDEVDVDAILVSHGHSDHLGDAIEIATRLDVPVIGPYELCMYCQRNGAEVAPMHIGGGRDFSFGHVKLTLALHGSAVIHDDLIEYTGPACGFVIRTGGRTVYYAGDTGIFGDMALIGEMNEIDVAVLPIGDNFTMGPDDAVKAAEMLEADTVVPMHYSAFDVIEQDPDQFADQLAAKKIECVVLKPGE
ncbi:MAG: metal-dependent hydrolase, partial [Armatimonadota bacterium]